ncbi:sodium-dependent phosphate transporter 1 [Condylostylus longicornis]|uniref:sodium-dependent phosphate transporter 1 n=1 Tax=Condylostylus longicornis TaxID=2530218 RepID=UPI00244E4CAA|nr:sodium-dependent phosphate transporter 1 [Condylostylus longicornis]
MDPYSTEILWIVILGFIIAFILAFGIGANDVANSFGTSVGSGVLSLRSACLLATVCEIAGAVLIGYKVSDTMRKGILEVTLYEGHENELMLGCLAALASSAVWLLVATFLKLPISGTHSIVGSTIGFSLAARGTQGLKWSKLGTVVGSWFISPVLSGLVSVILFLAINKFILRAKDPLKNGFLSLPVFYGVTVFINIISIVLDGPKLLYMDNIPTWIAVALSVGIGIFAAIIVQLCIVPMQRRKIEEKLKLKEPVKFTIESSNESSPSGSPKKGKRPLSLVSEGNQLPTIAEITELSTLGNLTPKSLGFPQIKGNNYKVDPDIIRKAEHLLGKNSLDNTDLTITSLNYIDEQQQNGKNLQEFFDNKNQKSPINTNNNESLPVEKDVDNNTLKKDDQLFVYDNHGLKCIESGTNMDLIVNVNMSQNSSRVPLIEGKDVEGGIKSNINGENESSVSILFSFLQILTATFGSFAHGGNDVSNAIGPLIALFMIYTEGSVLQKAETPIYILIYGGIGISIGLWLWGRRVIETIGNDLTKITPSTGFTIEIGAAITVLLASKIGLPISTTHCKVGSVVFVGHFSSKLNKNINSSSEEEKSSVDWHLFRNIAYAWVVTIPVTALLSAGMMYCLCQLVL